MCGCAALANRTSCASQCVVRCFYAVSKYPRSRSRDSVCVWCFTHHMRPPKPTPVLLIHNVHTQTQREKHLQNISQTGKKKFNGWLGNAQQRHIDNTCVGTLCALNIMIIVFSRKQTEKSKCVSVKPVCFFYFACALLSEVWRSSPCCWLVICVCSSLLLRYEQIIAWAGLKFARAGVLTIQYFSTTIAFVSLHAYNDDVRLSRVHSSCPFIMRIQI